MRKRRDKWKSAREAPGPSELTRVDATSLFDHADHATIGPFWNFWRMSTREGDETVWRGLRVKERSVGMCVSGGGGGGVGRMGGGGERGECIPAVDRCPACWLHLRNELC